MAQLRKRETLVPLSLSFIEGPHFAKILTAGQVREIRLRCRRDPETDEVIDLNTYLDALCETVLVDEAGVCILANNDAARLPHADYVELRDTVLELYGNAKKKTGSLNGSAHTNGSHADSHSTPDAGPSKTPSDGSTESASKSDSSG